MPLYLFGANSYSSDDESWQRVLRKAHAAKLRPVCKCVAQPEAPSLYIAVLQGRYVLKRMPFTGPSHAPHCTLYEPPPELSGFGQVNGSAVREDADAGGTTLALDFALTKGRGRPMSAGEAVDHESVRADGTKLTMRALLHYLYEQAGLNRWSPLMEGKRTWFVVRRELLGGVISKRTNGRPLAELMFIPESFTPERADEIKARRLEAFAPIVGSADARMLLVGEVKSLDDARYGLVLVIKHMPDFKLLVPEDLGNRLRRRFGHQLQLWAQIETSRLLVICTISRSTQGVYSLEAACLMNVDRQWLPFETGFEWQLLDALHVQGRRFVKGLRYNLPSSRPMASVILQDVEPCPSALYVVDGESEGEFSAVAEELSEETGMGAWMWNPASCALPALPPGHVGERSGAWSGHPSSSSA
jgi:hypothetical protein